MQKMPFFGVCDLLRLGGPLSAALGDISVILGTSRRICFTKDAVYNFLEVLGKKIKIKIKIKKNSLRTVAAP